MAKRIHQIHEKWWIDLNTGERLERNKYELLALVLSEISEALEGERKDLMDDHLPHRKMAEVEMADAAIRLFDYIGGFGYEISTNNDTVFLLGNANNKGETLFWISETITRIGNAELGGYPCPTLLSLAFEMIECYCKKFGYDLWGAIEDKLAYNQKRADHKHENRIKEGGKKF